MLYVYQLLECEQWKSQRLKNGFLNLILARLFFVDLENSEYVWGGPLCSQPEHQTFQCFQCGNMLLRVVDNQSLDQILHLDGLSFLLRIVIGRTDIKQS